MSEGKDQGYLKNVIFTPIVLPVFMPVPSDEQGASKSSGGSAYYILVLLTLMIAKRRRS